MSPSPKSPGYDRQHSDGDNPVTHIRRTKSSSVAQKIKQGERITRQAQHDRPFHVQRDSLLTWSSGFENFDGWRVYALLLFSILGSRPLLENLIRYGIQASPWSLPHFVVSSIFEKELFYGTPMFFLAFNFNFLFVYYLEHELAKGTISSSRGTVIHVVHLILVAAIPAALILSFPNMFSYFGRICMCLHTWIMFFKIWSYVQVNKWCRESLDIQKNIKLVRSNSFKNLSDESDKGEVPVAPIVVQYPNNLTPSDLLYFLWTPTLCYELNFPRSQRIRIGFLLKRFFEVIVGFNLQSAIVQQWVVPIVKGSYKPFMDGDVMWCTERILKLAIPFHCIWLIFFYIYFHSWLNVLAEILRFGDRKFYEDWWNARDLGTFWKTWNRPFHNWAIRHMYIPMLKSKFSRTTASTIVFTLSSLFHEYCVSIPLLMFKGLVFAGFFAMVVLVPISAKASDKFGFGYGNALMWLFQIIGLSMNVLVYQHDYLIQNISVNDL